MLTRVEVEGTTTFTYGSAAASHNIGRLQGMNSPGYSEQYTYDAIGRLSNRQIVSDATYAYDYTYNSTTGLPETLTYPTSTSSYRLKLQYLYQNGILQQVKDFNSSTIFWQGNASNSRGQITQETLGNGVITNRALDAVTGWVSNVQSAVGGGATLQNESYLFDLAGNLTQRQNNNLGLTENFFYDNLYRLDHSTLGGTTNLSPGYDAMGNITARSDVASGAAWTYHATKKHAVLQAGSTSYTYTYDANGNAQTRNGYGITWTSYNYPSVINGPNKTLTFSYGPDRQRFRQIYTNGSTTETTMYIGGALEKITTGSLIDWRHYIAAGGSTVAVVSRQSTGTNATRYVLEDHQGSIAQVIDGAGALYVSESFTAFGARRAANTWSGAASCTDLTQMKGVTRKGYTGHEAIGGVSMGLNHMNGRVQDAIMGRFLSPDPYVTEPGNTQGFNRYSYTFNNPLSYIDPSGFSTDDNLRSFIDSTGTRCGGYENCPLLGGGGIRPGQLRSSVNIDLESRVGFQIPRGPAELAMMNRGGQSDAIPADPGSTDGGFTLDLSLVSPPRTDMNAALAGICEAEIDSDFAAPETEFHGNLDVAGNVSTMVGVGTEAQAASLALRASGRFARDAGASAMIAFPRAGQLATPSIPGWQLFQRTNSLLLRGAATGLGWAGIVGDSFAAYDSFLIGDNLQGGLDMFSAGAGVASFASGPYGIGLWLGGKAARPIMKSTAKLQCRGVMAPGPVTPRF